MIQERDQENIHLDYKAGSAVNPDKPVEIAKDVSAFANSDGGVLVYGVIEERGFPVRRDDGVDPIHCSRERLEDLITSHLTPRLGDVRILALPLETGRVLYVVEIPTSFRGPHQASDKRYDKRHNFKSEPMEDSEINDVRSRRRRVPTLVTFREMTYGKTLCVFEVANIGDVIAEDVRFEFSTAIPWPHSTPHAIGSGIRRMPPRQTLRYPYYTYPQVLSKGSKTPSEFSVVVSYFHPEIGSRMSDEFCINLDCRRDSLRFQSDAERQMDSVIQELDRLNKGIQGLRSALEPLERLCGPTGLDLSILTLRNLRRVLLEGGSPEPRPVAPWNPRVFEEVLGVDERMAMRLSNCLDWDMHPDVLKTIPGMTDALLARILTCFRFKVEQPGRPAESPHNGPAIERGKQTSSADDGCGPPAPPTVGGPLP